MIDVFLTPEQEQYLRTPVAEKLSTLAIDTTNPALLKNALNASEKIQPWVPKPITQRIDNEKGR